MKKRVAILISGRGSNMEALIRAAEAPDYPAEIVGGLSNRADAGGLAFAAAAGIPAAVCSHKDFADRETFDAALEAVLVGWQAEIVCLAGFMRVLTHHFVEKFPLRIVNTHPSLLPAFPGVDAPAQALAYGVKVSGVTVHFVDTSLDGGPIIAQVPVAVLPGDDAAALHARIQREEHRLLPEVVQRLAAGRLSCKGRHVVSRAE